MKNKHMVNIRVTDEELIILSDYAEETGQSQTNILRTSIRSLECRLRRISPDKIDPFTLPSIPLTRRDMFPAVAAIYFFMTEDGRVLYVGETANLSLRYGNHLRYESALGIDQHARLHWLERRTSRDAFEKACIKRFSPELNVHGK